VCLYLNPWQIKDTKQDIVCLVVSYNDKDKMQEENRSNNLGNELNYGNEVIIETCNLVYIKEQNT
jgi:hypothetical protein